MLSDVPPSDGLSDGNVARQRHHRREVLVAVAVLLGLAGAMIAYLTVRRSEEQRVAAAQSAISAVEWLGKTGALVPGNEISAAPATTRDGGVQREFRYGEGESYYAPKPADLVAPAAAPQDSPAPVESADPAAAAADAGPPPAGAVPAVPPGIVVKRGSVQRGTPVINSLVRLGLTMAQAHALITALDGIFDFRRSQPGHAFEVHVNAATKAPDYLRYEVSATEVYEVRRQGETFAGRRKHIPTDKKERRFGGTIASSLYKTMSDLGAHPALPGKIMEVLSNQVDFYKAQRPGDTFRVMVEEESLNGAFLGYGPLLALEYNGGKAGKKRFFRFEAGDDIAYYDERGISQPRSVIAIPLHYTRISSQFGMRYHPVLKHRKQHNGVDFAASPGAPVWACQKGTVTFAGDKGANGRLVIVRHEEGLVSYYAHLLRFGPGIRAGVEVRQKQVLGYVGSTGRSTGPHLHFGLSKNGRFIDPLKYKVRPGAPVAQRYREALKAVIAERGAELDRIPIRPPAGPLEQAPEPGSEILGVEEDI